MSEEGWPDELVHVRDAEVAARLRAMHRIGTPAEVDALRARIRAAAALPLAERRRARSRSTSWLDSTSAIGRFAVPIGLVAAALCIVLLRQLPRTAAGDDSTSLLAYSLGADATVTGQVAARLLLPESADALLLSVRSTAARDTP
jgi:hypothetical protein